MKFKCLIAMMTLSAALNASAQDMIPLNQADGVKTLDCTETFTKVNSYGQKGLAQPNGRILLLDKGKSFFAVSTETSNVAFSGDLKDQGQLAFLTNQPANGITMGKGFGKQAGIYIYIGTSVLISWDCRK